MLNSRRLAAFGPLLALVLAAASAGAATSGLTTIKVKLVSSADTGYYYVTKKNTRTQTEKLAMKKYDPVARKHVEFREAKIK